jgi:hypothetical protein
MAKWEPHPNRPVLTEVLQQGGKTYTGVPNPDSSSRVKYIYTNEDGVTVCSAFRKDGLNVCTSVFVMPNGRCKRHGGPSPSGAASANFKTGKSSKYLPHRLQEQYQAALEDDTLMDMTEDLAVIDARLSDLYIQLDEGGGGEIFKIAQEAFASFNAASAGRRHAGTCVKTYDASEPHSTTAPRTATSGLRFVSCRNSDVRSSLSTAKHLQLTNQTITVTKVNLLISALLDSVRRNVADKQLLGRISADFMRHHRKYEIE